MSNTGQSGNSSTGRWLAILGLLVPALQAVPAIFPQSAKLNAYCTNYPPTVLELDSSLIAPFDEQRQQCQSLVAADVQLDGQIGSACQEGGTAAVNAALIARRTPLAALTNGHLVDYRDYRIQDTEYCRVANDGTKEAADVSVDLDTAPTFWILNRARVYNTSAARTINLGSIRPGSSATLTYVYLGKDEVTAAAPTNVSFPDGVGKIHEGGIHFGIASDVADFVQAGVDNPLWAAIVVGGCLMIVGLLLWLF